MACFCTTADFFFMIVMKSYVAMNGVLMHVLHIYLSRPSSLRSISVEPGRFPRSIIFLGEFGSVLCRISLWRICIVYPPFSMQFSKIALVDCTLLLFTHEEPKRTTVSLQQSRYIHTVEVLWTKLIPIKEPGLTILHCIFSLSFVWSVFWGISFLLFATEKHDRLLGTAFRSQHYSPIKGIPSHHFYLIWWK